MADAPAVRPAVVSVRKLRGLATLLLSDGSELRVPAALVRRLHLRQGAPVDRAALAKRLDEMAFPAACEKAASLLSVRSRTELEIEQALLSCGYDERVVARVMAKLTEYGYLNDDAFAEQTVQRRMAAGYGKSRIRQELRQKGVALDLIDRTLEQAAQDEEAVADGLQKALARAVRGRDISDPKDRQKIIAALARKGYSLSEASEAVRSLRERE